MALHLARELKSLWRGLAALDRQTTTVLTVAAVLAMWKYTFGDRAFFQEHLASPLGVDGGGIWGYAYLFGTQGLTGFALPAAILLVVFKRRPREIGLGLGDWKLALVLMGLYLPLVIAGCWILSDLPSFQAKYPLFHAATSDWKLFATYELLFVAYWIGWEYLWRGFVLFGTAQTFGPWAIFVQMLPFAALHAQKPMPEAYLSIFGALLLGTVVWRCRSFWIAIPIHALQMLAMDLFCTLRTRTGVDGIDLTALFDALSR